GDAEQHVAQLVLDRVSVARGDRLVQLSELFVEFAADALRVWPIKSNLRRLFGQPLRSQQRRGSRRNAVQHRSFRAGPSLLLRCLELYPIGEHLRRAVDLKLAEHMRVAVDDFVRDTPTYIRDVELALLFRKLRVEDDLEQQVAQLFAERAPWAAVRYPV